MSKEQQTEALRLAELIENGNRRSGDASIAAELRRLHARVQELEFAREIARACAHNIITAAQAQRAPLTPDELADKCEAWLQSGGASNIVDAYEAGFRSAERAHGITQENQQ